MYCVFTSGWTRLRSDQSAEEREKGRYVKGSGEWDTGSDAAAKTSAVNLIGSLHHMSLAVLFFLSPSKALRMNQNHETISRQRETSCRPTVAAFKEERKKKIHWNAAKGGASFLGKKLPESGAILKSSTVYRFFQLSAHDWTSPCPIKRHGMRFATSQRGRNDVIHHASCCTNRKPRAFTTGLSEWMNLASKLSQLLRRLLTRPFLLTN